MTHRDVEDYAFIGNCETAALISRDGSVDWLCLPRFDAPACFAALLGTHEHGRWQLAPGNDVREQRRAYRRDTLVLDTVFETDSGVVQVTDCMPRRRGRPALIRRVEGLEGRVPMRMELVIRFDYGSLVPWVQRFDTGLLAIGGPDAIRLSTPVSLRGEDMRTVAYFPIEAGQAVPFELIWFPSHETVPETGDVPAQIASTERWWRDWSGRCTYAGPWRDAVIRSLITLEALTHAPTGAVIAAPTTSLPERIGGVRNWDYRYCWLRDAAFALRALLTGGYTEEARAWRDWLLRAVAGDPADVRAVYGITGERRLWEREVEWLPGYRDSSPVRLGNAAYRQRQLDVFGEVLDALHAARERSLDADLEAWAIQKALLRRADVLRDQPDEGIWEVRGPRRHFTHSKVMTWVAFDRAVQAVERFGLDGPVDDWRRIRRELAEEVIERGFDSRRNTFVQCYGATRVDASLLMIPLTGFISARDPRAVGTVRAVQRELQDAGGLVSRYVSDPELDGLPGDEGTFLACSFWLVDNLVLQGRVSEATELFERLLVIRNDVGLLAEQYDSEARRQLGNFPQALSHLALINSASLLADHTPP